MVIIGHFALCLSWLSALLGFVLGAVAGYRRDARLSETTRRLTILTGLAGAVSLFCLGWAFAHDDYSLNYVWQFSNREMHPLYKVSAIWGGMDGSMLLWAVILALGGTIVAFQSPNMPRLLMPWVHSVINSSSLFFLTVTTFFTNPFRVINAPFIPPDGNGLNPLLQNPLMVIHPPTLYLGFTIFAVPYAFCIGALLSNQLSGEWIRLTRRWTLIAWAFLTAGIILGGHWAYVELGWGGFWAWDPVENASFFPWLTGTAFLHSVMIQERKNMLKVWNVWLIVLTYGLTVFGTFLTRSGVVQSVHAFASTEIGWVFLLYLAILVITALVLTIYRRNELKPERSIESFLSREAAFLMNNLLFLSICFATIWGVMFPVLSEAVTGQKQNVGIPFFNAVNVPLFLGLIFLMGVGPLIAWRRASLQMLRKAFLAPFVSACVVTAILIWAGVTDFYPLISYGICFFVLMTIAGEFRRGYAVVRAAQPESVPTEAVATLFRRHRSRYGGYIIHLGVLVATVGITASMAHKIEKEFTIARGEKVTIGRFTIELEDFKSGANPNYEWLTAVTRVTRTVDGEHVATLHPEKRFYLRNQEQTTEVALKVGLREDIYIALAGLDDSQERAAFKVFINPLQVWLWIGGLIMLAGTMIILVPQKIAQVLQVHPGAASEVK